MPQPSDRSAASRRALELTVASLLFLAGAVAIYDSVRVGIRWADEGPQAGYFPFYIGALLCLSSVWTFARALRDAQAARYSFVSVRALKLILVMLVPTVAYVVLVGWIGMYVASFLYVGFFMLWLGKYSWLRSCGVAATVTVISYLLFDVWFKLPLPKGPVETLLGLG